MNQTAVELLLNELEEYDFKVSPSIRKRYMEMEKQQIIDARINGDEEYSLIGSKRQEYAEQYYNETYNK